MLLFGGGLYIAPVYIDLSSRKQPAVLLWSQRGCSCSTEMTSKNRSMQTQLVLMSQLSVSPHLTHVTCFMLQKFQTTLPLKHISYVRGFTAGAAVLVDLSSEVQQSFDELSQVF